MFKNVNDAIMSAIERARITGNVRYVAIETFGNTWDTTYSVISDDLAKSFTYHGIVAVVLPNGQIFRKGE